MTNTLGLPPLHTLPCLQTLWACRLTYDLPDAPASGSFQITSPQVQTVWSLRTNYVQKVSLDDDFLPTNCQEGTTHHHTLVHHPHTHTHTHCLSFSTCGHWNRKRARKYNPANKMWEDFVAGASRKQESHSDTETLVRQRTPSLMSIYHRFLCYPQSNEEGIGNFHSNKFHAISPTHHKQVDEWMVVLTGLYSDSSSAAGRWLFVMRMGLGLSLWRACVQCGRTLGGD